MTATYLHAGYVHFSMNISALLGLGKLAEATAPRIHLPIVYLASAVGASTASVFLMPDTPSVGASGAILGIAGYLLVLTRRRPDDVPPRLSRGILLSFALTGYLGAVGFRFIDNAARAGGALTGAITGLLLIRPQAEVAVARPVLALAVLSSGVLLGGLAMTIVAFMS